MENKKSPYSIFFNYVLPVLVYWSLLCSRGVDPVKFYLQSPDDKGFLSEMLLIKQSLY